MEETHRLLAADDEQITELSSGSSQECSTQPPPQPRPHCSHDITPPSDDSDLPGLVVTFSSSRLPLIAGSGPEPGDSSDRSNYQEDENLIKTYRCRWYILTVFTLLNFMQGGLCISWNVIAESVEVAFGWTNATLSLLQDWLYITYLLSILPFAWLMDKKGEFLYSFW